MKKRIYGLETEYGVALVSKEGQWFCGLYEIAPFLKRGVPNQDSALQFQKNGSRIYLESGYHPEYSTPECATLYDLIAQDKAGERILKEMFTPTPDLEKGIVLFKNNIDYGDYGCPYNETYGCHENYLLERKVSISMLAKALVPFLVARQIICGTGWVADKYFLNEGIKYLISQRVLFLGTDVGFSTRASRAILCTARLNDEPHADREKYSRLHLILGDSNLSEVSTYLKMGTVAILLEMLEEGYQFPQLQLTNPVEAIRLVSQDLTCKKPTIKLGADGTTLSSLDLLWLYVEMIDQYDRTVGLNPELADVKRRFIKVLSKLETDPRSLRGEIEWITKLDRIEKDLQEYGYSWEDLRQGILTMDNRALKVFGIIRAADLEYHKISETGYYYILEDSTRRLSKHLEKIEEYEKRSGGLTPELQQMKEELLRELAENGITQIVSEADILRMMNFPPQDTRAKIRGDFVRLLEEKGLRNSYSMAAFNADISWAKIGFRGVKIFLPDPFANYDADVERLSNAIREHQDFSLELPPREALEPYPDG